MVLNYLKIPRHLRLINNYFNKLRFVRFYRSKASTHSNFINFKKTTVEMLDPQLFRDAESLNQTAKALARKKYLLDTALIANLEHQRKKLQTETQSLQQERNQQSKQIGILKAQGQNQAAESMMANINQIGEKLAEASTSLENLQNQLLNTYAQIPNVLDPDVPDGKDEKDNIEIRTVGTPPTFSFQPKDHIALGEALDLLDFETAAKLSGARFNFMKGNLAKLHRAIAQLMLDTHTEEHGYLECSVPYLVKKQCFFGTGQLPKFSEDFFHIAGEWDLSLISTAEIPLTNTAQDRIFEPSELPILLTAQTPCFRSEAGSYGKDTKGLIRQHQFEKIELVQLVDPKNSEAALEQLTGHAEKILQKLNLPYRVILLCAGDTGFSAAKTYDIEVWLPGQNTYREISSCSNCRDFQARRIKARVKNLATGKTELIHTLNGSGLAIGRTLVAILENYQEADGRVRIPEALRKYMGDKEYI